MTEQCKIDGCTNERFAKGLCCAHYLRLRRHNRLELVEDLSGLRTLYPKEYNSYRSMKNRCLCKTDKNYPRWGGKGIKICDRWLEKPDGFKNFFHDMGPRPDGTSLDRIDNNKGYYPDNCRWATPWEQMANTSKLIGRTPGVHFIKSKNKWEANIKIGDRRLTKSFATECEAIKQRKLWEEKLLAKRIKRTYNNQ